VLDDPSAYCYKQHCLDSVLCLEVLLLICNLHTVAAFGPDGRQSSLPVPNEHKYLHIYRDKLNKHIDICKVPC
jgi:hypothetical protein